MQSAGKSVGRSNVPQTVINSSAINRLYLFVTERQRSGTGYRQRAFDCGLKVVAKEITSTRCG